MRMGWRPCTCKHEPLGTTPDVSVIQARGLPLTTMTQGGLVYREDTAERSVSQRWEPGLPLMPPQPVWVPIGAGRLRAFDGYVRC